MAIRDITTKIKSTIEQLTEARVRAVVIERELDGLYRELQERQSAAPVVEPAVRRRGRQRVGLSNGH